MTLLSPVIIRVKGEIESILKTPQDYIIDRLNGEIILKIGLDGGDRLIARKYSFDYDVHRYLLKLRSYISDLKPDDRNYSNEQLLEATRGAVLQLGELTLIDCYIDSSYAIRNKSTKEITSDLNIDCISRYSAFILDHSFLRESIRNAIFIKEGKTTIDTTRSLNAQMALLEKQRIRILSDFEANALNGSIRLGIGEAAFDSYVDNQIHIYTGMD